MTTPAPVRLDAFDAARDSDSVARLMSIAFAGPRDRIVQYVSAVGDEKIRTVRLNPGDAHASACLARIDAGQYFGGRIVPMAGVAAVAVAPECRGGGLALGMMGAALREAREQGYPISTLYASTQTLYRQLGYEQAGHRFRHVVDLARLGVRDRSMSVRGLTEQHESAVRACYGAFARTLDGMLDRNEFLWGRTRAWRDTAYDGFGVFDPGSGALEGYVFLTQNRDPVSGRHDLAISDAAFSTPRAGRRLLGFLADFSSMALHAELFGGPSHPLTALMPQQVFRTERKDWWMVRLLDVAKAVAARGYAPGVGASVSLRLSDGLLPENAGGWRLEVEGGRGRLERESAPGAGAVSMDVRAFASLYSGFVTATQAALLGWVEGPAERVASLDGVFAGATPSMVDMF